MMSNIEHIYNNTKDAGLYPIHKNIVDAIILNEPALAEKEMKDHIDDSFIDSIFYSLKTGQLKL